MSEPRSAPTVGQVVLGKRLQDLRERVGLSRDQAAKVLRVAPGTIRRMETAEVGLKIPYVQLLLKAYGIADEETDAFVELAEEANKPGWWQRFHDVLPDWFSMYVSLEGAASLLRTYEPHFVPGLLQTEDYARSVLRTGAVGQTRPADIERHVALRMERQALLTKAEAPKLWVVMDETVLRRHVGGAGAMRAQVDRLLEATDMPHVTLQIAEFATGHHP
ncbi:helix-turn-helix domain-containing protein, partial [Streptomyces sp. NRRL S-15]